MLVEYQFHQLFQVSSNPRFFLLVILGSSTFGLFSLDLSIGRFFGKDVAESLCIKYLPTVQVLLLTKTAVVSNSEIDHWTWDNVDFSLLMILGTDLQAQIESQTAEHREQELFHNFKHQMMRKLRDIIFRGALDKDDREMATKNSQKVRPHSVCIPYAGIYVYFTCLGTDRCRHQWNRRESRSISYMEGRAIELKL